jgi:myo-inositol-1(or 4)-monophosphatase
MSSHNPVPVTPPPQEELRELAESAARLGGNLARDSFGQRQPVTLKDDRSEVTPVDLAVQRAIVAHLRAQRDQDTFIAEESPTPGGQLPAPNLQSPIVNPQSVCWVIDPIDGTRNYIRDLPLFTCSVAAMIGGEPVAGAIYDPVHRVMYSAARGGGTFLDGAPVVLADRRAAIPRDPDHKLFVGIPSARREATRQLVLRAVEEHVVRNFGSAALHLALTAVGQLDAAVMGNTRLWDIAAGCLLVGEAGGVATLPDGKPIFPLDLSRYAGEEIPVLAGSPEAHAQMLRDTGVS